MSKTDTWFSYYRVNHSLCPSLFDIYQVCAEDREIVLHVNDTFFVH